MEVIENTISAFVRAKEIEASFIEMDLCMTKDNRIVICHDENLFRLWGVNATISELNYDELPEIQESFKLQFSDDSFDASSIADKKIPLFEDVWKTLKDAHLIVEIKEYKPGMIEEAYKILKKYDMLDQIFWGSFKELHTQELIRVDQSIPRFASQKEITVMNLAYLLGFLPFISIPFDVYLSPFYNEGLVKTKPEEGISECKRSLGLALIRFMTFVSAPMISHLDKRGIDTMLWVLNDVEDLARALEIEGSPGVITDRPEAFISLLHKRYS